MAIRVLSRNNASEQPRCGPTVVGLLQIVGCTAVSHLIPGRALGHHFRLRTKLTPSWASASWRCRVGKARLLFRWVRVAEAGVAGAEDAWVRSATFGWG
jgi:hypothetical protein